MTRELEPADLVLRFLQGVGPGSEAEFYLRLFRSQPSERFATIAVLADALDETATSVAFDLALLARLGLFPIVVLGLDGADAAGTHAEQLAERARQAGVDTVTLPASAAREQIAAVTRSGRIPLVVTACPDARTRQVELAAVVSAARSHKLVVLRAAGGLRAAGDPLSVVNLSTQFAALSADARVSAADRTLLADVRRLIFELVAHPLLVAVASPLNVLHELFTVRGAGTLLRTGAVVVRHDRYQTVDVDRLSALLASGFGRTPRAGFFTTPPRYTYIADDYRGAALITQTGLGAYLTKFAVTRQAQGEGIGQDLWGALIADHPTLIWRARRDNPIRSWYERQCHGRFDVDQWTVYVRGLQAAQIGDAVALAVSQPVDFDL